MPFNGTPGAKKPGYVIEIVQAVFVVQGVAVDYAILPWQDTLNAARSGAIDGAIGTNATEGIDLVHGSEPIGIPRVGLFVRKDNPWKYQNLQSLTAIRMGAIASYSYWDSIDSYIKRHTEKNVIFFTGEDPLADALTKLDAKEIDVMPETLAVFAWAVKSRGMSFTDYHIAYLHEGSPIFIGFTKNERGYRYAKMLDEGIRSLRASGQLARILSNYGMEDWRE